MEKAIAYCGLNCNVCPAFLATRADSDEKRAEVAKLWSELYKADVKAEHINCDGCKSDGGRLFSHCGVCEIRKCARERSLDNCSSCDDYVCDKLGELIEMAPEAKKNLEELRG